MHIAHLHHRVGDGGRARRFGCRTCHADLKVVLDSQAAWLSISAV
jgi:hypothetical protein